jgi:hypothetical protein
VQLGQVSMLFRLVTFKIVTLLNCMFIETYSPLHLIHRPLFYTRARAQKAVKVNFIPNQQHATTIPLALSIMLPLVFYPYTQLK